MGCVDQVELDGLRPEALAVAIFRLGLLRVTFLWRARKTVGAKKSSLDLHLGVRSGRLLRA
eukprot:10161189-Lingulodinium_polyedra.AAC.1